MTTAKKTTAKAPKATETAKAKAPAREDGQMTAAEQEAAAKEAVATPKNAVPSNGPRPSPERKSAEAHGEEVESVRIKLKISELTTIPKRVFSHEVVILQTIHGNDKVEVEEGTELMKPLAGDAQEELDRLVRAYGKKGSQAVLTNYPNARALAEEIGISAPKVRRATKHGMGEQKQSGQRGGGVE